MVRKIAGKNQPTPFNHLIKNNIQITNIKDIADTLAETFSTNSSSKNSKTEFHKFKATKEKQKLNFQSDNKSFTLSELQEAIQKSHNTTIGPDDVHYKFLRHLSPKFLNYLLSAFNEIWQNGTFPKSWKMAIIISIPKPGKINLYTSNYRPIASTSCLCKTIEHMVNRRLVWFIEPFFFFHNLFTNFQCGFRSRRSTMDHVVRLETSIREAIIQKQHLLAIFFDLEKAYETICGGMVS